MPSNLVKLIQHDLARGFSQNRGKLGLALAIFVVLCIYFVAAINSQSQLDVALGVNMIGDHKASTADFIMSFSKGMDVYVPSQGDKFKIPVLWMMMPVCIALLAGTYPTEDLHTYATNILIRAKSRTAWWLSKCIWVVLTVLAFYAIGGMCALAFSLLFGNMGVFPDEQIALLVNGLDMAGVEPYQLFFALLLPIIVSITLSLFQMLLSFLLKPMLSYILVAAYLVASIYYHTPFLIGDDSMLLRNSLFYPEGIDTSLTFAICGISILVVVIVGIFHINRTDFLTNK